MRCKNRGTALHFKWLIPGMIAAAANLIRRFRVACYGQNAGPAPPVGARCKTSPPLQGCANIPPVPVFGPRPQALPPRKAVSPQERGSGRVKILSSISRLFGRAKALSTPAEHWERAYAAGGIPDSPRQSPSEAVVWAWQELNRQNRPIRHAVDVGCGKGRNTLYLAEQGVEVTALDFAPGAIWQLKQAAQKRNLSPKIRALVYDVMDGWPVQEHSVDFVVDAFCFKHIIGADARLAYKQNLIHAIAARGAYVISFASIGDGYYGQYIVEHYGDGSALAVDPSNNLQSILFTRDHVRTFFMPEFKLMDEKYSNDSSQGKGENVPRQTYAMLFERNPKSQGGGYGKVTPDISKMHPLFKGTFPTTDENDS